MSENLSTQINTVILVFILMWTLMPGFRSSVFSAIGAVWITWMMVKLLVQFQWDYIKFCSRHAVLREDTWRVVVKNSRAVIDVWKRYFKRS